MEYLRAALHYFTVEFLNFWCAKVWYLQRETGAAVGVRDALPGQRCCRMKSRSGVYGRRHSMLKLAGFQCVWYTYNSDFYTGHFTSRAGYIRSACRFVGRISQCAHKPLWIQWGSRNFQFSSLLLAFLNERWHMAGLPSQNTLAEEKLKTLLY